MNALLNRQFLVFLLTGGFAAAVNFFSRMLFSLAFSFTVAIVLAYLCGMVTAFVLARLFVFTDSSRPVHHSALWFVLINLVAVAQTLVVSLGLYEYLLPWLGVEVLRHEIAHAVGVVVPVFSSYFGHRYFTFR